MSPTQSSNRARSRRALTIVLGSAVVGWLLFMGGAYVGLIERPPATAQLSDSTPVTWQPYFTFLAIAALGCGGLSAMRSTARTLAQTPTERLARPVRGLATTVLIIALVFSALAAISLFFDGFSGGDAGFGWTQDGGGTSRAVSQTVNLYLPIVLHTALVVTLILLGFVFAPAAQLAAGQQTALQQAPTLEPAAEPASAPGAGTLPATMQRSVALGYTLPIVAAAAALIFGLIVSDLTRSPLRAWIWVIVLAIISVGIFFGIRCTQHGIDRQHGIDIQTSIGGTGAALGRRQKPPRAAVGARGLGFVLSIVLAGTATLMSLGYGTSAIEKLSSAPYLSIGLMEDGSASPATISVWGNDLRHSSEVTVTLTPGDDQIAKQLVTDDTWISIDASLPKDLVAGEYRVTAQATSRDGRAITAATKLTVNSQGDYAQNDDGQADSNLPAALQTPSLQWFASDVLPAGLLLVIAVLLLGATVVVRNREELHGSRD